MATGRPESRVHRLLVRSGVYYGWFVVAGCFLSGMVCFGTIYSFGVFFEFIHADIGGSYAGISAIFSIQSIVTFGGGVVLGFFVDQYGTRPLLAAGGLLIGLGLFVVSQVDTFLAILLAYGVVAAMGFSTLYVIAYATTPRWFERRLGLATAVATAGGGVGILAMPTVASILIDLFGWRDAYLTLMVAFLLIVFVAVLLVADHPQDIGAETSAEFNGSKPDVVGENFRDQVTDVAELLTTPSFAFVFVAYVMIFTPVYMLLVHVVEFANTEGIGRELGVLAISIIGAMNITGKFVFGYVTDRVGVIAAVIACSLLVSAGTGILALIPTGTVLFVGVFAFGLGYGGSASLLSPMLAELFGTANINSLLGVTSAAFALAGSAAPFLAGFGYDVYGSFVPAFLGGALLCALAGPMLVLAGRRQST